MTTRFVGHVQQLAIRFMEIVTETRLNGRKRLTSICQATGWQNDYDGNCVALAVPLPIDDGEGDG